MTKLLVLIDRTIHYGLQKELCSEKLTELIQLVPRFQMDRADVGITEWVKIMGMSPGLSALSFRAFVRSFDELGMARRAGFPAVCVVWDPALLAADAVKALLYEANCAGMTVSVALGNGTTGACTALAAVQEIAGQNMESLVYLDEGHSLDSFAIFQTMSQLLAALPCEVEFQADNSSGLATANTLAAIRAGVSRVAVSIAGLGGFTPLEEVIMAATHLLKKSAPVIANIAPLSNQAASCLNEIIPPDKSIIGTNMFAHESGIHVDGVIKCPDLYEPFSPETVGLTRKLVIGKHSGTASIKAKFRTWNVLIEDHEAALLLGIVRSEAVRQKCAVSDQQLLRLFLSKVKSSAGEDEELCRQPFQSLIQLCETVNKRPESCFPLKKN